MTILVGGIRQKAEQDISAPAERESKGILPCDLNADILGNVGQTVI